MSSTASSNPIDGLAGALAPLFEQAPTFMALLHGPEHRVVVANPRFMTLIGPREILGRPLAEALPEAVAQGHLARLDQVFASGEAFNAEAAKFELQPTPGGPLVERYLDIVYQPIKAATGQVTGIFVQGADVTGRVTSEAALRDTEARFRAALKAGRMGWWVTDHASGTRHWSPEGMALFGLDLVDGRGQVGGEHDEYVGALHPDDRHLAQHIKALAAQQDSFAAEYRIVRPDGTTVWLTGRGLVVERSPEGRALRLVSVMADSTERKLVEERFRLERERLDLALDAGQMGAYDLNFALGTIWWSPETYRLFGVVPEHFVPTPESVLALVHPDDQETFIRLRRKAIDERRPFVHELRLQRPDGSTIWVAHRGRAEYDQNGRPSRNFGVIMDITERKQVEHLLRDADRNKDNFIAMLAHELRNPLAPIRNAVTILRRSGPADAATTWCHEVIDRQVNQMARLLDDLLDVSRLSRGQLRLQLEPITVAGVVDQAIEIAQPAIYAGKHAFSVLLHAESLQVRGDATRLAQVLSNVLINAAKYTAPQGRIVLHVEQEGEHALIRVRDNGIGIAAQHLASIFEMFVRVETPGSVSPGGQGIGLSLAKSLLDLHGGSIAAFSDGLGKGTEFQIRLPLAPSPVLQDAMEAAGPAAAPGGASYRVLVADDLRDSADSLASLLRRFGHTVEVAYDGEQALQLADSFRPDIAILDLGMPGIDGYEACRRIRTRPWGAPVTLIAQTGWGQTHDLRRTREAGFDHHAVKPIELQALLAMFPAAR
ncbi:MAG TPA: PAS domain-containing protein [Burkholderiaceae bacterium]|nr:PAS domain-containing protein [Burkholderiaceae bacterium]